MKKPVIRLVVALLLTFCGGFCDVYTFITRGGVFANMQTGNLIKFFIALVNDGVFEIMYILPILFFFLGCLVAVLLHKWKYQYVATLVLLFITYLACGFIPQGYEWNIVCVCILSITGAMQFQTFRHYMSIYYTSTMCTNNMRLFARSIAEKNKKEILFYLSIIAMFCIGVAIGIVLVKPMGIYALCPLAGIYFAVLIIEVVIKMKREDLLQDSHLA